LVGHTNGEVIINMKKWDELGSDHKQVLDSVLRATSINSSAKFTYNDHLLMDKFVKEHNGEINQMDDSAVEQIRKYSMEVVDEEAKRDKKYSAKVASLLHDFMKMTGKM